MTIETPARDRWAVFEQSRRQLFSVALRMLRSVADAEDMVQEASLRWLQTDPGTVRAPEAWLVAVVTRLSVDRLRRAAVQRPTNPEARVPQAMAQPSCASPEQPMELRADLSVAFLALREHLEPAARSAFVLREAFNCDYSEIARLLAKSEANCRQIVRRARERVRQDVARVEPRRCLARGRAERFFSALSSSDREAVLAVLTQ